MYSKFLTTPVGSALRVALGVVLAGLVVILTDGRGEGISDVMNLDWWNTILGVAIAAAIPVFLAYFNRADPRFGVVSALPVKPPTSTTGG